MSRLLDDRYRRLPALALATLLATGVPVVVGPSATASAQAQTVTLQVDSISPAAPPRSTTSRPLSVVLTITNSTDEPVTGVHVVAERGYPITTRSALQTAVADPVTTPGNGLAITPTKPVTASVPASGSVQVTFSTTIGIPRDSGICECHNAVYPLLFTAEQNASGGRTSVLASTQTYLPVFYQSLPQLRVNWIWPIIDRPHRTTSDTVFEDDDLAESVTSGGRLDRALSVVEQVDPRIALTLVLDPETIDELQVMSAGGYRVVAPSAANGASRSTAGTGQQAAAQWLDRLRAVLAARPSDAVVLTPYADPDVQTLASRGRTWVHTLPAAMASRVATALGTGVTTRSDLAWPAASRIGRSTLDALSGTGVRAVVLDSAGVRTDSDSATGAPGVATVAGSDTDVTALLTDSDIEKRVASAVAPAAATTTALPALLADLAVRVTSTPTAARVTVLTPPRYVDPSVSDAVATIDRSSTAPFTTPVSLSTVLSAASGRSSTATLRTPGDGAVTLRDSVVSAIRSVRVSAGGIRSLVTVDGKVGGQRETATETAAAQTTLYALPVSVQRLQSSAWRTDSGVAAAVSDRYSASVAGFVGRVLSAVFIVKPSTGVYTLASRNSDLPITVQNDLDYPVYVVVGASTVSGVPGFSAKDIGVQSIPARSTRTVRLPVTVQRSGRIQVRASLDAADDTPLGSTLELTVHSTALGRIGVIITIVAGALLVLALLVRGLRWARRKRRRSVSRDSTAPARGATA